MPLYSYKCTACKRTFDVRHGMFFEEQRCIHCHSDEVFRLPSDFSTTAVTKGHQTKPTGQVVDEYITETRKAIKEEKKKLSLEEF